MVRAVAINEIGGLQLKPYIEPDSQQKERFSSWALFILIMLLIVALFTSYILQQKKVQAVHETVISIFAGRLQD
jgi:sodium/hydrogen exchanger-like protein 6/7